MEEAYARVLTDELFGPQNQLGSIVWQSHYSPKGGKLSSEIAGIHETLICVAQELDAVGTVALPQPAEGYSNPDGDPRGDWKAPQKDAGRDTVKLVYNLPPYRWELAKGRLPPGIWRISPFSGVIWGEPTQAGEWEFTVKVIDVEERATTKSLSLTVDPDGGTEMPEGVWWMDHPPKPTKSKPRIRSARLPNGVVGRPYSVLLEASGGTPVLGQKRPRRGWGFGREKLIGAIVEDRCYFGRQGTAIPEPKRYLSALDEGVKYVNVTSWWPGTAVGWSQDATKHLRQLEEAGITSEVVETAKPEQLMVRLIDAFTTPGDPVLEMFARAGDLSAVALKMGRPFVALAGGSELDRAVAELCCVPRLMGICSGEEGAALGETEAAIPIGPSAVRGFTFARLSAPLAVTDPMRDEFPRFLRENYKDPDSVAQAVLTCQGYVPTSTGGEFVVGALVGGRGSAVAVRPDVFLDRVLAAELAERVAPDEPGLTVFFFRSDEDLDPQEFPNTVNFRRVPMELGI